MVDHRLIGKPLGVTAISQDAFDLRFRPDAIDARFAGAFEQDIRRAIMVERESSAGFDAIVMPQACAQKAGDCGDTDEQGSYAISHE